MKETINEMIQRLKDWKSKFEDLTVVVARGFEAEAVDLVTQDQLKQGVDNMGRPIEPFYTPFTIRVKREKGQEARWVTLEDEGDYHGSVKMRFGTGKTPWLFVFYATDKKAAKLEAKYGKDLLGLNESSLEEFNDLIRDDLIATIQKAF